MRKCINCQYYVEKPLGGKDVGECRLNPPQPVMMGNGQGGASIIGVLPPVQADNFCSQFKMREAALNA